MLLACRAFCCLRTLILPESSLVWKGCKFALLSPKAALRNHQQVVLRSQWKCWWVQWSFSLFPLFPYAENNNSKIQIQRWLVWSAWLVSLKWKCMFYNLNQLPALNNFERSEVWNTVSVSADLGRMQVFFPLLVIQLKEISPGFVFIFKFFFSFLLWVGSMVVLGKCSWLGVLIHPKVTWWQTQPIWYGYMICRISDRERNKGEEWFLQKAAVHSKNVAWLCFVLRRSKGEGRNQLGDLINITLWKNINIYSLNEAITTKLQPYYIECVTVQPWKTCILEKQV